MVCLEIWRTYDHGGRFWLGEIHVAEKYVDHQDAHGSQEWQDTSKDKKLGIWWKIPR